MSETAVSAADCRRAAGLVLERAAKATEDVCPTWQWWAVRHIARNVDLECSEHQDPEECCEEWNYENAAWFSLVDARIAEPLAAWLRAAADHGEEYLGGDAPEHAADLTRALLTAAPAQP